MTKQQYVFIWSELTFIETKNINFKYDYSLKRGM